ncbi:Glu/Leu/Phe/Val dehydrogenase dimerization domain-containing protein [Pseudonocardia acaciae]|uniref:Glu/Leu/Phe/Val dehydrogenase dimerization domain-containing protein n=1 Tax=Pseudonocardia acaciae TaxID=551276 RepID=UPI000490FF5F|nr:Glu/Leu/Phe/Val dehydrogenase dimerization domain-containing protein [Pseudonocardia acaciae]
MPLALPNAISAAPGARADAPYLEVGWSDPESEARGYLVIDRLVRGLCSGGLRMRAGCTTAEVRGLARGMTLKEALHYEPGARYVPLGGAKGGIDFDPYHPDAEGVLFRYLAAMRPMVEHHWSMGEDLGVRQDAVDRGIARCGLDSSVQAAFRVLPDPDAARARLAAAFATVLDGVRLDELVGGYGVAQAALAALGHLGRRPEASTAVIQGFGSMGGATARYLAAAGVRVVGIADVRGLVANPAGLDVERLLRTRTPGGELDRSQLRAEDERLPGERWLSWPADVLVPAAASYVIDAGNHGEVAASLIVEAANMPVTPEAEDALRGRGVLISPDFLANSATNAWWWWVLFGDIDAGGSFDKIRARITELSGRVLERAGQRGTSPRAAALALATENLAEVTARYP